MAENACEKCCNLSKDENSESSCLDHAFQFRYRGDGTLADAPILHVQAPGDELRADDTLSSEKVGAIKLRIAMWPRDRNTTHHSLDKVLRVLGEVIACGWPEWSALSWRWLEDEGTMLAYHIRMSKHAMCGMWR